MEGDLRPGHAVPASTQDALEQIRKCLAGSIAAGAIVVFPFPQEALEDMVPTMLSYTDRPRSEMDLADATLVWLANDTGVLNVMTTDVRDFSRYRLADGRAFEIL